jgi:hypothetical protein
MTEVKSTIPFPPYDYKVNIIFTDDIIKSADKLADAGVLAKKHTVDATTQAFTVKPKNMAYGYIVLEYKAKIHTITHESYHALVSMFRWIGATHEEEVFAYHIGYLVHLVHQDQLKAQKKLEKVLDKQSKQE